MSRDEIAKVCNYYRVTRIAQRRIYGIPLLTPTPSPSPEPVCAVSSASSERALNRHVRRTRGQVLKGLMTEFTPG